MPANAGIIEYEMGYGADEFGNVLQGAFSGEKSPYRCETLGSHYWRMSQVDGELNIEIQVLEMPPRRLGLFALPVLQVIFHLHDTAADDQTRFFDRFHKYFHKGGG
jgi:hypothetical protein